MIDFTEVDEFADHLRQAGRDALDEGEKIVSKGGLNVKTRARELAPRGPHTPYYRDSIRYDMKRDLTSVSAEVGADDARRQYGLSNILEYGTADTPPHPHFLPAADEEEPRFYSAAEDLAARVVERHG